MTPILTVNLLRTLFVTFCAAIGATVSSETQGNVWPGLIIGITAGLPGHGLGTNLFEVQRVPARSG